MSLKRKVQTFGSEENGLLAGTPAGKSTLRCTFTYSFHIPGTCLCCCHGYIQPLLSGPETKCKRCCAGLYCLLPREKDASC